MSHEAKELVTECMTLKKILTILETVLPFFTFSVGDSLAFYEENTRDFLFPEPKLTPLYPGVERELLMKTSSSFPVSCLQMGVCHG